jgi:hypothetical protein
MPALGAPRRPAGAAAHAARRPLAPRRPAPAGGRRPRRVPAPAAASTGAAPAPAPSAPAYPPGPPMGAPPPGPGLKPFHLAAFAAVLGAGLAFLAALLYFTAGIDFGLAREKVVKRLLKTVALRQVRRGGDGAVGWCAGAPGRRLAPPALRRRANHVCTRSEAGRGRGGRQPPRARRADGCPLGRPDPPRLSFP